MRRSVSVAAAAAAAAVPMASLRSLSLRDTAGSATAAAATAAVAAMATVADDAAEDHGDGCSDSPARAFSDQGIVTAGTIAAAGEPSAPGQSLTSPFLMESVNVIMVDDEGNDEPPAAGRPNIASLQSAQTSPMPPRPSRLQRSRTIRRRSSTQELDNSAVGQLATFHDEVRRRLNLRVESVFELISKQRA